MENLRLGVSAVRHDMRRAETVEEAEKNTELGRQTPKAGVGGSNPFWRAKIAAIIRFSPVYSGYLFHYHRNDISLYS